MSQEQRQDRFYVAPGSRRGSWVVLDRHGVASPGHYRGQNAKKRALMASERLNGRGDPRVGSLARSAAAALTDKLSQ